MGQELGLGDALPTPSQLSALRQAVLGWTPAQQLGLLRSTASFPRQFPAGLGLGIKALAGDLLTAAVGGARSQGASWEELQGPIQTLLQALPDRDALTSNLLAAFQASGQGIAGAGSGPGNLASSAGGGAGAAVPGLLTALGSADLSGLGSLERNLGIQKGGPTEEQLLALRSALLGLAPDIQLGLMAGLSKLPGPPEGLALGLNALAPEVLATATHTSLSGGVSWPQLRGPIQDILSLLPGRKSVVRSFASHLRALGMDPAQAEPILRDLAWDDLSVEAKLLKVLEHGYLFELSLEQRLALLRELLDLRRFDEFLRIQEVLLESLRSDWPDLRMKAAHTLVGITRWAHKPGLPAQGSGPLMEGLRAHFAWEPEARVHRWTTEALDLLLADLVLRGALLEVISNVQELDSVCAFLGDQDPWRNEALAHLHTTLGRPELLDATVDRFLTLDRLPLSQEAPPYLALVGEPLMDHLVTRLEAEQDRTRRGKLVEVFRNLGPTALPPLLSALGSSTWYLVRNALTLLAELGNASCLPAIVPLLGHAEPRVRRTAVRALWKLGGAAAEPHLLNRMKETDAEAMQEILFAFGQLRSERSLAAVAEFAQDRRVMVRLRIQAMDTLGLIATPKALPILQECLRRKGFFAGSEPPAVRLAAARALLAMGTPEARAALQQVVAAEPKGEERESFRRLLDQPVSS